MTDNTFTPSNLTVNDIEVGKQYNVHKRDEYDLFNHTFVGTVLHVGRFSVSVEDQDGDIFDVEPDQLTVNTDDIMHD